MITGAHAMIYSTDADGDRAFFRDVLGLGSVDAGGGWLIFALPPAEVAVHPAKAPAGQELYLMCDEITDTVEGLRARGAVITRPIDDQGWGLVTAIELPGGGELGLYEPRHPSPVFPGE
jgi:predicted enzyme related to lactoylglutathione lyase